MAMRQMRKQASWYLKGVRGAARARDAAVKMEKFEDLVKLIENVFPELDVKELLENI